MLIEVNYWVGYFANSPAQTTHAVLQNGITEFCVHKRGQIGSQFNVSSDMPYTIIFNSASSNPPSEFPPTT